MPILYQVENVQLPSMNQAKVTDWIKSTVADHNKRIGDIAYIFCDDDKILEINKQYLQHNYYTDIITFDYSEGNIISGDLFISLDTVKSNSLEFKTNETEELYRVMIHGILHLCGINDKTEDESVQMRKLENSALDVLRGINILPDLDNEK